jgi:signal transduction histidine kinase
VSGARARWRPRLSAVLALALAIVATLPLAGIYFFRIYENQLVRQTEAELVAQSAALAAMIRAELAPQALQPPLDEEDRYAPILPELDLTSDRLLPQRPQAQPAAASPDPAMLALGARLAPVIADLQRVTLAGFRLLDSKGVVVAGRDEIGQSLAHVEEVAAALAGRPERALRLRVLRHETPPLYSLSRGTQVRVFLALPVMAQERVLGVVYASRTPPNIVKHLYEQRGRLAAASALILLAATLAGLILHRAITSPLKQLVARTDALARGDRTALAPTPLNGTVEFAHLGERVGEMARALYRRSDYVATFAAHVSHELKSPLTAIRGAAELLRDVEMTHEERARFLDNIRADASRLAALLTRLRDLARAEATPLAGEASAHAVVAALAAARPGRVIVAVGEDARVAMSEEALAAALGQLCDNAFAHDATRVAVSARRAGGERVALIVADDGLGVSPANRSRVFDAFFSTRRDDGGTGMGLPIVQALAQAHGGSVTLESGEGPGATFRLDLPAAG